MKSALAKCNEDAYLPSLHLSTVESRCKLQGNLHRVTWPGMKCASVEQSLEQGPSHPRPSLDLLLCRTFVVSSQRNSNNR